MENNFKVSTSFFFKVTTLLISTLIILISLLLIQISQYYVFTIFIVTLTPILLFCYTFSINKIKVDLNNIYLISIAQTITIPIKDLRKINKKSKTNLIVGNRGFLGLLGRSIDNYRCNIKNTKNMVTIELDDKKYLISCDLPDELIKTINTIKNDKKTT